jgi:hypothetical protein
MKPEESGETSEALTTCETPGCSKEAKLQCPTCIKLKIQVRSLKHFYLLHFNSCYGLTFKILICRPLTQTSPSSNIFTIFNLILRISSYEKLDCTSPFTFLLFVIKMFWTDVPVKSNIRILIFLNW